MHQIVAAKRGEDITLDSGERIANDLLTYRPYPPMSYAYCSDTNYSARLARMVEGVDMLYHEATYAADMHRIAKERGHATTADAAKVAQMAGAGRLLIGHFSSRYKDLEALLAESREIFPSTDIARERETFLIEPKATKL
jgi:ribonuclease Z